MIKWKIAFWTPGSKPQEDGSTFGCASHGFSTVSTWKEPGENATVIWDIKPEGEVLAGKYAEVLEKLQKLSFIPKGLIAVFPKNSGIEKFTATCKNMFGNIPMIGGGAAVGLGQVEGEILPASKEVAVLAVSQGNFKVETLNIHENMGKILEIELKTERIIGKIKTKDGEETENIVAYYRKLQEEYDVPENDFECVTFSDMSGRNIHCSVAGDLLSSGADLPEDRTLVIRKTNPADATREIAGFISKENTIVFGCAGLRSLLEQPVLAGSSSIAGFMFGELFTIGEKSMFGNLMMTRLTL